MPSHSVPATGLATGHISQTGTLRSQGLPRCRDTQLTGLGHSPHSAPATGLPGEEAVPYPLWPARPAWHPLPCLSPHLVVVGLTVGQTLLLIVPVPQERLLTLGADEVLGRGARGGNGRVEATATSPGDSPEADGVGGSQDPQEGRGADTSVSCRCLADLTPRC